MAVASHVDFLVMGAGVAGLRAAIELADHGKVLVVTKESVAESNTHYAQGGIAVAMEGDEDISLHLKDTVGAGDGLVNKAAARVLVTEGPQRVAELMEWGARFDREGGRLVRTREGAHSLARILHANGDATGAEISRSLAAFAREHKDIRFAEWTTLAELIAADGKVIGANLLDRENCVTRVFARAVLIAAGGAGQVYSDTTNPAVATGDGIALAAYAGAELADMEFYQFHPTAFSLAGAPRFLLSEALRGEGAYLRNDRGERFMERYHPLLELAPRDVVARAITLEGTGGGPGVSRVVHLDMRQVQGIDFRKRFPGISGFLARYGLDLHRDLIPVRPAAHYLMGGIRTDVNGRTSLRGLYAAGEAACTGAHGANRLASNSLLEGLVFGRRIAETIVERLAAGGVAEAPVDPPDSAGEMLADTARAHLQQVMSRFAGVLRDRKGLDEAERLLNALPAEHPGPPGTDAWEATNLLTVATVLISAARLREETRGTHWREDFPDRDDAAWKGHIDAVLHDGGLQVTFRKDVTR
jgi:L-aspartate oxidase